MIGIFLITHDHFGEALIQCACHVLSGRPEQIIALGVAAQDDPARVLPQAKALRDELDSGDGVLVLTDIFGATPANIAVQLLGTNKTAGLSGVNLPMLLRALTYRHLELPALLAKAIAGGRDGIIEMQETHAEDRS